MKRYYAWIYPLPCIKKIIGSEDWLIAMEMKFSGKRGEKHYGKVKNNSIPDLELLIGGDRMFYHHYAKKYAEYIHPFTKQTDAVTLVEIGIFKGCGLAIWCDLFPKGNIIGLDIDLGHINGNINNLKRLGAFEKNYPKLYEFDQYLDNQAYLGSILNGDRIDVCIDDAAHSNESILRTMQDVLPHLADNFVYFIEDNSSIHEEIRLTYPHLTVESDGELTIVCHRNMNTNK